MLDKILEGIKDCVTKEELEDKLKRKKILKVKYGADPSKPDLHLGHYICLRKLKDFQELGHRIIFVIGDFTAMIGDPSGRSKTRPRLSEEEVKENSKTYMEQVFKILDPEKTEILFNSSWLSKLSTKEVIELAAKYTVARMLEREDFKKRLSLSIPISIHEFLYPLFQAYDSVYLQADVEIGGEDQFFNFALTREIQKGFNQEPQVFITVPLIEGLDGKLKMSKSYNNSIDFNDTHEDMFGKVMSINDDLMIKYYKVVLRKWNKEIENFIKENPRDAKENLAFEIVKIFHGEEKAKKARENFIKIFRKKEAPLEIPSFKISRGKLLVDLIYELNLLPSKSEVRRLIRQGGIKFDSEVIKDVNYKILNNGILKIGKRKFLKIEIL
ncbi:MAG: tyrosine--tRNA ligase [candidate division WOR-3 bacterium]